MKKKLDNRPFWERKSLQEMTTTEWESLCDGCAKCCVHKLEDEDTGEVFYTNVVCRYLTDDCRCPIYETRPQLVPNCAVLTPDKVHQFHWMPQTCAYRLLAEGKPLEPWHPLISGTRQSVHDAEISIMPKVISEEWVDLDDLEDYIVESA